MGAGVKQRPHLAIGIPKEDKGAATDVAADVVAAILELGLVSEVEPAPIEQLGLLSGVDVLGGHQRSVDPEGSPLAIVLH
jgi:hypothetical protein